MPSPRPRWTSSAIPAEPGSPGARARWLLVASLQAVTLSEMTRSPGWSKAGESATAEAISLLEHSKG
eukprot:scaffold30346_cov51-Phaeocystis_antarctica.AAC.3